ncbi:hypothetical protein NITGR_620008 [Nitrospina gracilis 3/211]|uniref:Uncharacterized protein n=1 Tax=Nitrospina gracilis (strain 3/211) TaxID=1266370 RepID=M1Z0R2_NITG3|nr:MULTISPECIES: class I SAM-dependent methyltransferase [Nitrospina]MCF8724166.1 SAM-dependent methyltransferase [Nitrospina sp. Nb-3]CCQ91311.1 hypothetical protein NITGR_620008 [Nitrospina gracilis 3/211]
MIESPSAPECRICQAPSPEFYRDDRTFHKCPQCWYIFTNHLPADEVAEGHYKMQWGDQTEDMFKGQADGVLQILSEMGIPHQRLLDFGSGSGALTRELQSRGFDVTALDPMEHGFLNKQNYAQPFDAVIAVEVIEHLPNPLEEIRNIVNVMVPEGVAVFTTGMTTPFIEQPDAALQFGNWWYKDDPTHIGFFCERTLAVIGGLGPYTMGVVGNQAFTLQK